MLCYDCLCDQFLELLYVNQSVNIQHYSIKYYVTNILKFDSYLENVKLCAQAIALHVFFQTHRGVLGGGHYVAYTKNPNGKWYEYNDSMVKVRH